MYKLRYVLLFGLPTVDLAIPFIYSQTFRDDVCGLGFCWGLGLAALYVALSWATIFLILFLIAIAATRLPTIFLRAPMLVFMGLCALVLILFCLTSWAFNISNGIPPNPDVVIFLAYNILRVPHHLLQTSPVLAITLALVLLVLTFGFAGVTIRSAHKVTLRGAVLALAIFVVVGGGFMLTTAPFGMANVSGPALVKMALHRFNPLVDEHYLDPELAKNFTPVQPYAPAKELQSTHPVIVILVESLRRDLIEMDPTPIPFLKSIAEDGGIFFDKAYATASHSNYADVAFWYSRYPMRSLNLQRYHVGAPYRGVSLFSVMKQHGYQTAYISSQNELWGSMINWLNVKGEVDYFYHSENFDGETWWNKDDKLGISDLISKGVATAGKIEDSVTLKIADRWIENLKSTERFMLGMNLQNTHFSYVIPPGGTEPYQPADLGFRTVYYVWPAEHKERVRNRYLNAVVNLDRILSEFAARLQAKGVWDNALVVIVGDSGEAFHEHGFGNHSGPAFDEAMRTFALIKPPKNFQGRSGTYQDVVSHLDITATIPDILGMPVPTSFQGQSILAEGQRRPAFIHTNAVIKQNAIVSWPWKLMQTYFPFDRLELYNLVDDPEERVNRQHTDEEVLKQLNDELQLWIDSNLLYYSDSKYYDNYDPPK